MRVTLAGADQFSERRFSGRAYGRLNSAAARGNLLVGGARSTFLKLIHSRAGKHRVCVGIDEAGQNNSATCINYFAVGANQRLDRFPRTNFSDSLGNHQHRAVGDK
jgi:hypothetical protein